MFSNDKEGYYVTSLTFSNKNIRHFTLPTIQNFFEKWLDDKFHKDHNKEKNILAGIIFPSGATFSHAAFKILLFLALACKPDLQIF